MYIEPPTRIARIGCSLLAALLLAKPCLAQTDEETITPSDLLRLCTFGGKLPVSVHLSPEAPPAAAVGSQFPHAEQAISREEVTQVVERRLGVARIYGGEVDLAASLHTGQTYLYVSLDTTSYSNIDGLLLYRGVVHLRKWVLSVAPSVLDSDFGPRGFFTSTDSESFWGTNHDKDAILNALEGALDDFIVNFLRVNESEKCKAARQASADFWGKKTEAEVRGGRTITLPPGLDATQVMRIQMEVDTLLWQIESGPAADKGKE